MQNHSSSALKFVILLGCISLFADATYEGARSVTGAYLGALVTIQWTRRVRQTNFSNYDQGFRELTHLTIYECFVHDSGYSVAGVGFWWFNGVERAIASRNNDTASHFRKISRTP